MKTTQPNLTKRPARTGSGWRFRRGLVFGVVALVVLAGLGFGIRAFVDGLSRDRSVPVIADDSMSPGKASSSPIVSSTTTIPVALTGAKAELWREIQRVREGVKAGTLVLEWPAPGIAAGDLPSDPMQLLDSLEKTVFTQDVTFYLLDEAGEALALRSEITAMPEVSKVLFVSKAEALEELKDDFKNNPEILEGLVRNPIPARLEVWLEHPEQAASFAKSLRDRPGVDETQYSHMDYAGWTERLRRMTYAAGAFESSTTWGTAPANEAPAVSSTSSTTETESNTGPKLGWGLVAQLSDRQVRVDRPVPMPEETGTRPGSMVVYSLVTITNTGAEAIDYSSSEFFAEGNSSGGNGISTLDGTIDGLPILGRGTLPPGDSVTAAVCFSLKKGDVPVKVKLTTPFSTNAVLASWQ